MRILYVTPLWSGFGDIVLSGAISAKGMPAFVQPLKHFMQKGHQVDFLIAKRNFSQEQVDIGVDWLKNSLFYFIDWNSSFPRRLIAPFLLYKMIQRVLKQQKYDFIYGHGSLGAIANIAANKNHIPCGIRLYGTFLFPEINNYSHTRIFIKHPLEYLSFRLRKSFLLITNDGTRGDEVYDFLKQDKNAYKFYFWLNGVESALPTKESDLAGFNVIFPYLIYPARIARWKRQHLAVELLYMLNRRGLKLHLYFIGHIRDNDYWDEIKNKIAKLELCEFVHYLGIVTPLNLEKLNSDATAVLSLYECSNLGNVVIEALSIGALVVSLNDGSLHNIIEDGENGILVDNISQAAERISAVVESPDLYWKIRNKAKNRAPEIFKTWAQRAEEEMQLVLNAIEINKN